MSITRHAEVYRTIRGYYRDQLLGLDGQVRLDGGWRRNTIVDGFKTLLGASLFGSAETRLHHLAVGQGDSVWDSEPIPPASTDTTGLLQPFELHIPALQMDVGFLNPADDSPSMTPTSVVQVRATLGPDFPTPLTPGGTYPLREFGLFGRIDETDFMINVVRHPVIDKDNASILVRTIQLRF